MRWLIADLWIVLIFLWYFNVSCYHSSQHTSFQICLYSDGKRTSFRWPRVRLFALLTVQIMQRKNTRTEQNKRVCFAALCIFYVLNLLSDDMKPSSVLGYVYIYLFMLCDSAFFFLMKVPFDMSGPMLRTHSVPHSLLLYSVHVKWILICVQNVDKDENTLDYILCTYLCLRVDSQAECILSLIIYYSCCRWYFQNK